MTELLAHRGPEDFGYARLDPHTGSARTWTTSAPATELSGMLLGHRRLSILDLTPGGHQPMFNDDSSMVVAFNGAIYNDVELRDELQKPGVSFRTRSDKEVLLKAHERWGHAAFARFNGMWAFTLWDGRSGTLIACRERLGVKSQRCSRRRRQRHVSRHLGRLTRHSCRNRRAWNFPPPEQTSCGAP